MGSKTRQDVLHVHPGQNRICTENRRGFLTTGPTSSPPGMDTVRRSRITAETTFPTSACTCNRCAITGVLTSYPPRHQHHHGTVFAGIPGPPAPSQAHELRPPRALFVVPTSPSSDYIKPTEASNWPQHRRSHRCHAHKLRKPFPLSRPPSLQHHEPDRRHGAPNNDACHQRKGFAKGIGKASPKASQQIHRHQLPGFSMSDSDIDTRTGECRTPWTLCPMLPTMKKTGRRIYILSLSGAWGLRG